MPGALILAAFLALDLGAIVCGLALLSRLRAMADPNDVRYRTPRRLLRSHLIR